MNTVKDGYGKIVGFRCFRCGDIVQSMWGTTCSKCRYQSEENEKLRDEIKQLRETLEKKLNP